METERRYLTVKRAVEYSSLSEASLYRLMKNKTITKIKPPGIDTVLVDRLELDRVLHGEPAGASA
jgi:hypothetical protein